MKKLFFIVIIFFLVTQVYSQVTDEKIQSGINYIYHLKFDSARLVFVGFVKSEPQNPAGYFGLTLLEWWKVNLDLDDETNDDNFFDNYRRCTEVFRQRKIF